MGQAVPNPWSGQRFPHPPGRRPVVGDLPSTDRRAPVQNLLRLAPGLGPLFEMRVFGQRFVFVASAALAAELCDEHRFHKGLSPALVSLRQFAGDGLFTAYDGEPSWQLAHDLLMPAFTKQAMQRYHPVMLRTAAELFAFWDDRDGRVEVSRDMTRLTLETLSRAAFSHDFGSFTNAQPHPFVVAMVAALRTGQRKGVVRTLPFSGPLLRRMDRRNASHDAYVETMLDDLVAERRRSGHPGPDDLLGLMLDHVHPETGERLTDLNIRYQILTFLVAGHETTSGALSFALYYLSRHPDVLARARRETDEILGPDPDAEPTFEQVPRFRHIRRVLDESLRLWPTAPAFARSPREPTTIGAGVGGGPWPMRPEDWALVVLPLVHRDPEAWGEDAAEFDPDRFLPERGRGRAPHAYKPFGTGERACIGRQFALHEAVLVLARLVHRYDLEGDPAYRLQVSERLTLMPRGFELRLSRRTREPLPAR
jgi:unspecific monooxygenase